MRVLSVLAVLSLPVFVSAESDEPVPDSPEVTQLAEFLETGFNRRRASESDIQSGYRDLNEELNDPLVTDYAYALVLLKQNKFDDAIGVLDQLREHSGPAYAPAWQASIWNLLTRRNYETAYEQLVAFAKMTSANDQQWSQLGQAERNARWIGKLVEGLSYQFTSGEAAKLLNSARGQVEAALPDALKNEFLAGVKEVRAFRQQLEGGAAATQAQVKQEQAQTAEETAKELKEKQAAALDTKDQLKLTAEEWKKKLDKELVDFGRKIGSLQRDYAFLEARAASLERSITLVQREKTALDFARQNDRNISNRGNDIVGNSRNNQYNIENSRLLLKYNEYKAQQQQTFAAMQQTAAQGTQLLAQRQALVNEYQQATGQLVKQDNELEKLAEKLGKKQEAIAAGDVTTRDPAELKQLRKRMRYFSTYVNFDFEEEKQKLIDSVRASQSQGD